MPEHLRSLVFILLIAVVTFFFIKKMTASIIEEAQFNRWRNTWLGLTTTVFLAGNFWLYAALSALLLLYIAKQEKNPFALFLSLIHI